MFESIDHDQLESVHGGQNRESTTVGVPIPGAPPIMDRVGTRSDYGYCVDNVTQQTANAFPDTRPTIFGHPLPFTTDRNAVPRANATMRNMRATCGQPGLS